MDGVFNMTHHVPVTYPLANVIFPNKTVILVTKKYSSSFSQQIALLAGMAFIGGIVAGLLIRCLYHGVVKYFLSNMDQLATSQRPARENVNPSFVDDNFRCENDLPPDYVTVMTENSTDSDPPPQENSKPSEGQLDAKAPEELPPAYTSVVLDITRLARSASA